MKKVITILLVLSIVGLSSYFVLTIQNKSSQIDKSLITRQSIKWFQHFLGDQNISFNEDQPACLIFFNPECDYCGHEAQALYESRHNLEDIQWFWISEAGLDEINRFKEKYRLSEIQYLQMICDSTGMLSESVGISAVPRILVYDHFGNLLKEFQSETKIEAILSAEM